MVPQWFYKGLVLHLGQHTVYSILFMGLSGGTFCCLLSCSTEMLSINAQWNEKKNTSGFLHRCLVLQLWWFSDRCSIRPEESPRTNLATSPDTEQHHLTGCKTTAWSCDRVADSCTFGDRWLVWCIREKMCRKSTKPWRKSEAVKSRKRENYVCNEMVKCDDIHIQKTDQKSESYFNFLKNVSCKK